MHGDPVDLLGARRQLVAPRQGVQRRRGEDLHLVAAVGDQVLGQHAGPGLRPATDLETVAGHHVGDLHDRRALATGPVRQLTRAPLPGGGR